MTDTSDRYVDFSDEQSKRDAQQAPSQTQGDSPRSVAPQNETPAPDNRTVNTGRSAAPTTASKSEAVKPEPKEEEKPQSYVWLGNGEVLLVNDEDLPENAGHGAGYGYWEKDGKVHKVVAVHEKEITKEKN